MRVLVTGATGKLGPHIVRELLDRGVEVSALVRGPDRARGVLGDQVDLVEGGFADTAAVAGALGRVEAMCLLTPHGPQMATTQNVLIDQAARAGTRVVKVSGTSSGISPDGPDACRQHYDSEQYLAASGVAWAVVRPNGFMQTLVVGMAATVRDRGVVVNPLGRAGIAVVDCADVGAATAEALCNPVHDGRHHVLTGPAAPTYAQMAATIGEVTGRDIGVVDVTPEQAGQAARARGLSAWEAGHLTEMLHLFARGGAETVDPGLPALIGRPPRTVAGFVADHQHLFTSS